MLTTKRKICILVGVLLLITAVITPYAFNYVSINQVQSEISDLEEQINAATTEINKISDAKESLHNAAESLRGLSITSESLVYTVDSLSSAWSEIDYNQTQLEEQLKIDNEHMNELSDTLAELEAQRGRFFGVFTATAYHRGEGGNITSTGKIPQVGRTIAVDPTVIPYGTKLHIYNHDTGEDMGYRIAEDCGGAIKGNIVDLFMETDSECRAWGRRSVDIYIVD